MARVPKNVRSQGGPRCGASHERGFTLIDMLFVIALIGLLSAMALPSLTRARTAAQSAAAVGTIRTIGSAQLTFAITCGLGFYAPDLPALGMNPPGSTTSFLSDDLASATTVIKSSYSFTVGATPLPGAPAACNGVPAGASAPGYAVLGDPLDASSAPRYFGSNADAVIYEHNVTLNGIMPEFGAPAVGTPFK